MAESTSQGEDASLGQCEDRDEISPMQKVPSKKLKKDNLDDLLTQAAKVLKEPSADELDTFGQHVAVELRGIKSDQIRRKTKRMITLAILQAQEEDELLLSAQTPTPVLTSSGSSSSSICFDHLSQPRQFNAYTPSASTASPCNSYSSVKESSENQTFVTLIPPFNEA